MNEDGALAFDLADRKKVSVGTARLASEMAKPVQRVRAFFVQIRAARKEHARCGLDTEEADGRAARPSREGRIRNALPWFTRYANGR
jgi:hypothetical protein